MHDANRQLKKEVKVLMLTPVYIPHIYITNLKKIPSVQLDNKFKSMGWHGYLQDGGAGAEKLNEKVLKNS